MQAIDARRLPPSSGLLSVIGLVVMAVVVTTGTLIAGPLALLPIVGALVFAVIVARPEYGIALFLSTFLMTYPASLQGSGFLTINNVLGGIFLILLTYKMYREEDWWFLGNRELQIFAFIILLYYLSDTFNAPDARLIQLLGVQEHSASNVRTFINRVLFTVFFMNFIRAPGHVRMIYLLALAFMVVSALTGVLGVLRGTGFAGYRASTDAGVIASAWNPNRLAMFAILAIAGLWHLMRSWRIPGLPLVIIPTIAVLALAVFMTASRSGLLGLGVCGLAIVIDERTSVVTLLSFGLAVMLLLIAVIQFVPSRSLDRITNLPLTQAAESGEGSGSLERRQYTWTVAWELFLDNPVLGVGMGNWEVARFMKDPARSTSAPHSSYLLALVEGGVFCLLAFLVLLWRTWRNIRFAESHLSDPQHPLADLLWIVKASKTGFLVLVFFSIFADLWQLVILFWLVGLAIVIRRLIEQTPPATDEPPLDEAFAY